MATPNEKPPAPMPVMIPTALAWLYERRNS
jgi:hypothetical protein